MDTIEMDYYNNCLEHASMLPLITKTIISTNQ